MVEVNLIPKSMSCKWTQLSITPVVGSETRKYCHKYREHLHTYNPKQPEKILRDDPHNIHEQGKTGDPVAKKHRKPEDPFEQKGNRKKDA
jgi:hypothetical protein